MFLIEPKDLLLLPLLTYVHSDILVP